MLQPARTKFRKTRRRTNLGIASRGTTIAFGDFAIKATESGYLTARQIESARKVIVRALRKGGKLWIRIFPDRPYTKKALGVPMGGGKAPVEMYRAPIRAGRILFELSGVAPEVAEAAFTEVMYKLPLKTKILLSSHI